MADSRFESVEVDQFIDLKKNDNTKRKTSSDVALFQRFLKEIHDIDEDLEKIEPELLNKSKTTTVVKPTKRKYAFIESDSDEE